MSSIIIIDKMHPSIVPGLERLGYQVDYRPDITRGQLLMEIRSYLGLVVRSKTVIDEELLDAAVNLRFVARAGAGVDNLDQEALNRRDITIVNAPEGNRDSLAEQVTGMLLNMLHRISAAHDAMRNGIWDREGFRGTELGDKTVGLIGCGNMGTAVAKRLASFNCQVLGYDKYLPEVSTTFYQRTDLEQLYHRCDILSLHVPLTNETRGFYNYSFFQQFKRPLILVNSARGEILPLDDLVKLMEEKKITGACLDVFQKEPLNQLSDSQKYIYDFLISSPNILLTPHVAGWSVESYQRINQVLVQKIAALNPDRPRD